MTTALVMSGGGSKGAFTIGALEYILGVRQPHFDIVVGTSTGALIAPFIVADQAPGSTPFSYFDVAKHAYLTNTSEEVVTARSLTAVARGAVSVFDTAPLERQIAALVDDEAWTRIERAAPVTRMFVVTVCLQTGEVVFFQTGPDGRAPEGTRVEPIATHAALKQAILASANLPILMPPVKLRDRQGRRLQYVDGGVREYASLRVAVANGADEIYAIYLSPPPEHRAPRTQEFENALPTQKTTHSRGRKLSIVERTLDIFLLDVFENDIAAVRRVNDAVRYVEALRRRIARDAPEMDLEAAFAEPQPGVENPWSGKRTVTVHEIFPPEVLEVGTLDVEPSQMFRMYDMGYEAAERYFARPHT